MATAKGTKGTVSASEEQSASANVPGSPTSGQSLADDRDGVESQLIRPIYPQRRPFWIALTLLVGWLCYLAYLSFG